MSEDEPKQPDLSPEEAEAPDHLSSASGAIEPEESPVGSTEPESEPGASADAEPVTPAGETETIEPLEPLTASPPSRPSPPNRSTPVQGAWDQARPVLRTLGIQSLRTTIRLLEFVLHRLEGEPTPSPSPAAPTASADPSASTSALGRQTTPTEPTVPKRRQPAVTPEAAPGQPVPASKPARQQDGTLRPLPERLWEIWVAILRLLRAYLPRAIRDRISNAVLTGLLVGLLVVVVWNVTAFFSPAPAPSETAQKPKPSPAAPSVKVSPSPQPVPVVKAPPIAPSPSPSPSPKPSPSPAAKTSPSPALPQASPVSPELERPPEQGLIAEIQDQVAAVTNRYAAGLIQSVQANFRENRLTVRTSTGWYDLSEERQDQLANDVLKRARELDFIKLEIRDPDGELLARSPVVGPQMVILQRSHTDVNNDKSELLQPENLPGGAESTTVRPS